MAVDGYTAAGKSTFADELAEEIRSRGRSTLRASLDDFKRPWRDALQQGYDRTSGEGYYRNAHDFDSARELLLEPAGKDGDGRVALCAHDPLTGEDHRDIRVDAPATAVLITDGVFALRPEYNEYWEYRIWLHVPRDVSLRRGIARDTDMEGREEAERIHRDRYQRAERIYLAQAKPLEKADAVVDNTDFAQPQILTDLTQAE